MAADDKAMTTTGIGDDMVTVVPATGQDRPVIANLLQLMLYDLSPLHGEWIGREGRYDYAWLQDYWISDDRHPYLILRRDQLAGFALVMAHSPLSGRTPCWFMAEFFILKAQRRQGHGQAALRQLLAMHRGRWEIAVFDHNRDALAFWSDALAALEPDALQSEPRTHDDQQWTVHGFVS